MNFSFTIEEFIAITIKHYPSWSETLLEWDSITRKVDGNTIALAKAVQANGKDSDLIRCLAAGNPEHPPIDEAYVLMQEIAEDK